VCQHRALRLAGGAAGRDDEGISGLDVFANAKSLEEARPGWGGQSRVDRKNGVAGLPGAAQRGGETWVGQAVERDEVGHAPEYGVAAGRGVAQRVSARVVPVGRAGF